MANLSFYLMLLATCGCCLRAAAAPQHHHHHRKLGHAHKRSSEHEPKKVELVNVLDKAVCPIRLEMNDDPLRVPRWIKELKCGRAPSPVCAQKDVKSLQACCGQKHDHFSTECVEVTDNVLVSYKQPDGTSKLEHISVSVGCTCMVHHHGTGVPDD